MPRVIDEKPGNRLGPDGRLMNEYLLGIDADESTDALPTQSTAKSIVVAPGVTEMVYADTGSEAITDDLSIHKTLQADGIWHTMGGV